MNYQYCGSCMFWVKANPEHYFTREGMAQCRKNPAVLMPGNAPWGVWPQTFSGDWCGAWEAKSQEGKWETEI